MALFFLLFLKIAMMTIDNFTCLDSQEKVSVIFDAEKIAERMEEQEKIELFRIDNFYIEIITSPQQKFKRTINTYSLVDLPAIYARKIISVPLVVGD